MLVLAQEEAGLQAGDHIERRPGRRVGDDDGFRAGHIQEVPDQARHEEGVVEPPEERGRGRGHPIGGCPWGGASPALVPRCAPARRDRAPSAQRAAPEQPAPGPRPKPWPEKPVQRLKP